MSKKENYDRYLLGQSVGLEEAANFLLEKGTGYFKNGKDDIANLLRNLSKELQKKSDDRYEHPKV